MKPLELELGWFGQYTTTQVVPFHRLAQVFLITGETGAGKTTLFDAISYALYGRGLGSRADGAALRSQLATARDSTVVRFRFEVRGVTWEVTRSPYTFVRMKRTGTAAFDKFVTLRRLSGDGSPEDVPPAEVAERLRQVIGLGYEDFSKILVLPQGEFQQFLAMKSGERAELLKTIFPVRRHEAIADLAKREATAVRRQVEQHEAAVQEVARDFDEAAFPTTEATLLARIEALRAAADAQRQAADDATAARHAGRALADQIASLVGQRAQLERHQATRPEHDERAGALDAGRRAARAIPEVEKLEALRAELARIDDTLARARGEEGEARRGLEELRPDHDGLPAREEALLEATRAAVARRQRLADLHALAAALRDETAQRDAATARADHARQAQAAVTAAELALQALDEVVAARDSLRRPLTDAERALGERTLARDDAGHVTRWASDDAPRSTQRLDAERGKLAELQANLDDAERARARARVRLDDDAALLVASALRPGEPCPACGSTTHPRPHLGAPGEGDARALLAAAEQRAASALAARGAQEKLVAEIGARADAERAAAAAAAQRLRDRGYADPAAWKAALDEATATLAALRTEDERLATQLRARPGQLQAVAAARQLAGEAATAERQAAEALATAAAAVALTRERVGAVADLAAELVAAEEARARAEEANRAADAAIRALRAAWELADRAAATTAARVSALAAERADRAALLPAADEAAAAALHDAGFLDAVAARAAARPPRALEELQRQLGEWESRLASLVRVVDELDQLVAGRPAPDLPALNRAEAAAAAAAEQAAEARRAAEEALRALRRTAARLAELRQEKARLLAATRGLLVLARHLNGDVAPRIDFATWMLTWWLERVLVHASGRMASLSDGRYTFLLRTTVRDGRACAGLDVDVLDTWSNQRRDVNALSGGEKFLASLSLALGLADVVQSQSGGVQLDTLFIDEGFGSLDGATLDRAMDLIDQLSRHRAVGLISHVEAMQRAVHSQVVVKKSPRGSTATVV